MKRPLINEEQRLHIRHKTYYGSRCDVYLKFEMFKREAIRSFYEIFKI